MTSALETLPLFRHPYNRNRSLFALIDICLLLLNSVALHRFIATRIIPVSTSLNLWSAYEQFVNKSQAFSDVYIAQLEVRNTEVRAAVNESLEEENVRVQEMLSSNWLYVSDQMALEQSRRTEYNSIVAYLQAWTRVGNRIPYYEDVSENERSSLEAKLSLEDGASLKVLSQASVGLNEAIRAQVDYNIEYIGNKTQNIPSLLNAITASLELQLPSMEIDIRDLLRRQRDQTISALRSMRDNIGDIYERLNVYLYHTQLGFEDMAQGYLLLVDIVRQFYEILDDIDVVDINFDFGVFPRIDIDNFPSPEFFKPDVVIFPSTLDFLRPLDEFLSLQLPAFDQLGTEIMLDLEIEFEARLQEALATLTDFLVPDDYNPPPIIYGKTQEILSPSDALRLDAEIIANITRQINLPTPPLTTQETSVFVPNITLDSRDFDFTRPEVKLFNWELPDLLEYLQFFESIFSWLFMYYIPFEVFILNTYRALTKAYEYFQGTAVPLPVVDIRTKAEQDDQQRRKRSKINVFLAYFFHPFVLPFATKAIVLLLFVAVIYVCFNYFLVEFQPYCVDTNLGTIIAKKTIEPLFFNRALADGQRRAADLGLQNHVYIQEQCQVRSYATHNSYHDQVVQFETSRLQTAFLSEQQLNIRRSVDVQLLCMQHKQACEGNNTTYYCPKFDDKSFVANPCDFDWKARSEIGPLQDIAFNCAAIPSGNVYLENVEQRAKDDLDIIENWCLVEWYSLGNLIRLIYIICSYFILWLSFRWLISGLKTYLWTKLRPEEFHIHCTADREGNFTQPEYSAPKVKAEAIAEWVFYNKLLGVAKLALAVLLFSSWIFVTLAIWRLEVTPMWFTDFSTGHK